MGNIKVPTEATDLTVSSNEITPEELWRITKVDNKKTRVRALR